MPWIPLIFAGSFFLRALTALCNIGFIAIDDYDVYISRFIPYQRTGFNDIIEAAFIRSPVPNLVFRKLAGLAYAIGLHEPAHQLHFLNFCMACLSMVGVWVAWKTFDELGRKPEALAALALVGLGFVNPLFSTRVMIEALAAPFIAGSAYLAFCYMRSGRAGFLVFSLVVLAIGSMFRFQSGVCAFALLLCVLARRNWKDLAIFLLVGVGCFLLTGWIDWSIRGEFHGSLRRYYAYCVDHAADYYGTGPVWLFAALLAAFSLPPAFLSRYRGFAWREKYRELFPFVAYFLVFLVSHSLVKHKEERFMIPILPLFWMLLAPLAIYFWERGSRWRLRYFATLNAVLLVLASFNVPQNNIIATVRFVDKNPQVTDLVSVGPALMVLFPRAFVEREIGRPREISPEAIAQEHPVGDVASCGKVFFALRGVAESLDLKALGLKKVTEFSPGLLELAAVKLNPRKNLRRDSIWAIADESCQYRVD